MTTMKIDLTELVKQVSQLPPLPAAVTEVMLALNHEALSANRCIELIEQDPALAGRTLRLANSAFYGAPGRVGTIGDAVRMLGLRTVSGVLTAAATHQALSVDECEGFDFPTYWRNAIATGLAARALAPAAARNADEAFLAALMHNVGQLVMAVFYPAQAADALALARKSGCSAEVAENVILGFNHSCIGALVVEHWRFPPAIARAIAVHHSPEVEVSGESVSLSWLVRAACEVAHALDQKGNDATTALAKVSDVWSRLGLGQEDALRILATVETGTREMSDIMQAA
jgi:HD-like signal output (HDOD) protein